MIHLIDSSQRYVPLRKAKAANARGGENTRCSALQGPKAEVQLAFAVFIYNI